MSSVVPLRAFLTFLFAGAALWPARAEQGTPPAEVPVSEEYLLRAWEAEDGLPNNSVSGIAQTPDGYLWLATWGGLARFDGVRFTTFLKDTSPGLESNYVRSVFASRIGELWIGLERGGVACGRGAEFATVVPMTSRTAQTSWTSSFAEDAEGAVWFGRAPDQMAFRWLGRKLSTFSASEGLGPDADTFVHADGSGKIWFATKGGCGVFDGARRRDVGGAGE